MSREFLMSRLGHLVDQHGRSPHHDAEIQPECCMTDILDVHFVHFAEGGLIFATHLPTAREARERFETLSLLRGKIGILLREAWSRANQAHFPHEDIEELGQFIKPCRPQQAATWNQP